MNAQTPDLFTPIQHSLDCVIPGDDDPMPAAYFEGYDAGNDGKPESNPYKIGSADWHEFHAGYAAGAMRFPEAQLKALSNPAFIPQTPAEAEAFYSMFCRKCKADDAMRAGLALEDNPPTETKNLCQHLCNYFAETSEAIDVWIMRDGKPVCTEFSEFEPATGGGE